MITAFTVSSQKSSEVEPIVDQMVERTLYQPELKIQNLLDRLFELNREPCINAHSEAKAFLMERVEQIDYRSPLEPLGREELRFYNYCSGLIDNQSARIDQFCLEKLKNIVFVEPLVPDAAFEAYRIGVIRKQTFERELKELREDVNSIHQRLTRYMTMTPLPMISIPATNGIHQIPEMVPENATHILIYIKALTSLGRSSKEYEIVLSNSYKHQYRFYYYHYGDSASYNSENIWVEICSRRELIINNLDTLDNHCSIRLFYVGYK